MRLIRWLLAKERYPIPITLGTIILHHYKVQLEITPTAYLFRINLKKRDIIPTKTSWTHVHCFRDVIEV